MKALWARFWCLAIVLTFLGGAPLSAWAHRMLSALSVVELGQTSGKLEVTHRIYTHDLEHALDAGAVGAAWFITLEGQSAIRAYCEKNFLLADGSGRRLPLRFVGIEMSADLLYVYYEGPRYRGSAMTIDSDLLQDAFTDQVNQINVRRNGRTVSSMFQTGAEPKRVHLP